MMRIQISAGQGPAECQLAVAKMTQYILRRTDAVIADCQSGERPGTYRSVVLAGDEALRPFLGNVQWICASPYRRGHKRRNWFIQVTELIAAEVPVFAEKDVVLTTFHSAGKGGQNVNKVETAVRAVHLPTGLAAVAMDQRSQKQNRAIALARLQDKVAALARKQAAMAKNDGWRAHYQLERGGAEQIFVGENFRPK